MAGETGSESDGGLDISAILSPTTSGDTETSGDSGAGSGQNGGSQGGFKFGGKSYESQQAAEQAHNKLYGQFSDTKSTLNQLKEALQDPKLFAQFSKDPKWSSILAKLGIQQAEETFDRDLQEDAQAQGQFNPQQLMYEARVERAESQLEREEWRFERELGRAVTNDEHKTVLGLIAQHHTLTYKQAWDLAFHEKMMKEALSKAQAQGQRPKGNRPPPLPPGIPGVKLDTKKSIGNMTNAEWRENLRQSPEIQDLLNGAGR